MIEKVFAIFYPQSVAVNQLTTANAAGASSVEIDEFFDGMVVDILSSDGNEHVLRLGLFK